MVKTTVSDLGRMLAGVQEAYRQQDAVGTAASIADDYSTAQGANRRMELLDRRAEALRRLILASVPKNLEDAAVQVAAAIDLASDLRSNACEVREVHEAAYALETVFYGILPLITAASGLNPSDMRWNDCLRIGATRFVSEAPAEAGQVVTA